MGHSVKSCGNAHATCRECNQRTSDSLSEAMLGNINQIADELDAETAAAVREELAGRRVPLEERREVIQKARAGYYAPPPARDMPTYQRG